MDVGVKPAVRGNVSRAGVATFPTQCRGVGVPIFKGSQPGCFSFRVLGLPHRSVL